MFKHIGKLRIPSRITGRAIAYSKFHNPIETMKSDEVINIDDCLWCYSAKPHTDYPDEDGTLTLLVVLDSNDHRLSVENYVTDYLLTRGDVILFSNDITHSLTRPNKRKALFSALFNDFSVDATVTIDTAKNLLEPYFASL